jgi:hypothetical protein
MLDLLTSTADLTTGCNYEMRALLISTADLTTGCNKVASIADSLNLRYYWESSKILKIVTGIIYNNRYVE